MSEKYERFAESWRRQHPLSPTCTATEWADWGAECGRAFRDADPEGYREELAELAKQYPGSTLFLDEALK